LFHQLVSVTTGIHSSVLLAVFCLWSVPCLLRLLGPFFGQKRELESSFHSSSVRHVFDLLFAGRGQELITLERNASLDGRSEAARSS